MGKNKKRKKSHDEQNSATPSSPTEAAAASVVAPKKKKSDDNPLQTEQCRFLNSLPRTTRTHFFSPIHVTPEERAGIWESQADLGESLVNSYAWATPDRRLLKVFKYFGPIVEVGCGANAYWSKWMNAEGGVDVVALDASLDEGGKILIGGGETEKNKKKKSKKKKSKTNNGLVLRQGGPQTLSEDPEIRDSDRTLFLCYPDEDVYQQPDNNEEEEEEEDDEDGNNMLPMSMGAACLEHYTGSTIIHVGELYGDTLSLDQAPFGRSSSSEFQQRLFGEYHCILKMKLKNNWLHVRDTLSVWKRSETCCIAFENDDDNDDNDSEEDEEDDAYYKYIPPEEVLPADVAAPCVAHLLGNSNNESSNKVPTTADPIDAEINQWQEEENPPNDTSSEDELAGLTIDDIMGQRGAMEKKQKIETPAHDVSFLAQPKTPGDGETKQQGGKKKKKRKKKKVVANKQQVVAGEAW